MIRLTDVTGPNKSSGSERESLCEGAGHADQRYKPEQIVTLLRQIEVEIANGKITPQTCKEAEVTVQTSYRWRKEFGGLKLDQAKRLKKQEKETRASPRSRVPCSGDASEAHTMRTCVLVYP